MQRINAEMKQLQANLKLTQTQFGTNSNSMEALRAKGEALAAMHKTQTERVQTLKNALENAKQAQETYAQKSADLKAKIEANNRELERLKNTTGDTSAAEAKLTAENEKLSAELTKNEGYLTAAEKGVQKWQLSLTRAETDLAQLDNEIRTNNEAMQNAGRDAEQLGDRMRDAGDGIEEATNSIGELDALLASAGIAAMLHQIAQAFEACVDAAAGFEFSMSAVEAISGASTEEMEKLNAKAKEIGGTTMYTAQQASDALSYMALAGWSAEEMLSGVDGVISLAAASGEDLAMVSDIVTDSLTAFGLKAQDAGRFVDVLAAAAANSNTTVNLLGEAFKYAAPVAGALGYSVNDVAVAMGLMANNGIKGSMAGTALRQTFTSLSDSVKLSGKAFGEVEITGQNADGTMKGFAETINELRGYFAQMSEAEKVANAQTIAGQRAYAGLLAIINSTEADYNSLTDAINNSTGAAERMAKTRMDNYTGQVTLLKSAFDAVKISVGSQLTPALGKLAGTLTPLVSGFAEFVDKHERFIPTVTAVVGALATFVGVLGAAAAAIKVAQIAMAAFTLVMDTNPIFLAISAIAALAVGIGVLAATMRDEGVKEANDLREAVDDCVKTFDDAQQTFEQTQSLLGTTADAGLSLVERLKELESQSSLTADQEAEYAGIIAQLQALFPDLNLQLDENTGHLVDGAEALERQIQDWKDLAIIEARKQMVSEYAQAYVAAEDAAKAAQQALNEEAANEAVIRQQISELQQRNNEIEAQRTAINNDDTLTYDKKLEKLIELNALQAENSEKIREAQIKLDESKNAQEELNSALDDAKTKLAECKTEFDEAAATLGELTTKAAEGAEGMADAGAEVGQQFTSGIAGGVSEGSSAVGAAATEAANAGTEAARIAWQEHSPSKVGEEIGRNFPAGIANGIRSGTSQITSAITSSFTSVSAQVKKAGEDSAKGFKNGFQSITSDTAAKLSDLKSTITSGTSGYQSQMHAVGSNMIYGMVNGLNSGSGTLYSTMRAIVTRSIAVAQAAAAVHSPSKKMEWIYQNVIEGGVEGVEKNQERLIRAMQNAADLSMNVNVDTKKLEGMSLEVESGLKVPEQQAQVLSLDVEPLEEKFDRLESTFLRVIDAVHNMAVVLDSGAVVGEIVDDVDERLGYKAEIYERSAFKV